MRGSLQQLARAVAGAAVAASAGPCASTTAAASRMNATSFCHMRHLASLGLGRSERSGLAAMRAGGDASTSCPSLPDREQRGGGGGAPRGAIGPTAHFPARPDVWSALAGATRSCQAKAAGTGQLSRQRVFKSAAINDVIMPNTTQLKYGMFGIRAVTGQRVAANTIEAVRRTLRRKIKRTARLWVRIAATVPVTRKPMGIRMGKGKGLIDFYATAVRPGQIIFEMDRVPRQVALQALTAAQHKFPCKLGFVEWS